MAALGKPTLLIVDDSPEHLDWLAAILEDEYRLKCALSGEKALALATQEPRPDLILLDVLMPETDGYDVCRLLKANPATAGLPVIFVTAKTDIEDEKKGLALGAVDYIVKPFSPPIVKLRVRTQLALFDQRRELERMVRERTAELRTTRLMLIQRLGRASEFKDNETGMHIIRMAHYARLIAEAANASEEWSELIFHTAPMHDVGKIGIPDRVLLKPGPLDDDEWRIVKTHPQIGADIIGRHDSYLMRTAREIALTHHEKWDGSGYPDGLTGDAIPLSGRIVAVADVFDALTSVRPYKKAWSVEKAVDFLKSGAGSHFDPRLIDIFIRLLPEALKIRETYADGAAE